MDLQALLDGLAARIGRSAAIDDPRFRMIAYSAQHEPVDQVRLNWILTREVAPEVAHWVNSQGVQQATGPVRIKPNARLGLDPRVCIPLRHGRALLGFLWLIDHDGSISETDLAIAMEAAGEAAAILHRDRQAAERDRDRIESLLRSLLGGQGGAAELLEAQALQHAPAYTVAAVGLGEGSGPWIAEGLRDLERRHPRRLLHLAQGDHSALLLAAGGTTAMPPLHMLAEEVRAEVAGALIGLGDTQASLDEAPRSYRQALTALLVARARRHGNVVSWSELGPYTLIAQLPPVDLPPGFRRLLARPDADVLLETLEVVLDAAGVNAAVAAALGIHRVSAYARLRRIEDLTGLSIADGQQRLLLHMALKLHRLYPALASHGTL